MNLRNKENINGEYSKYSLNISGIRSDEMTQLVDKYSELVESIMKKKKDKKDISKEVEGLSEIQKIIEKKQVENIYDKNILKGSNCNDKEIGRGKDSTVYEFQNNSKYIYKEGKEAGIENVEYLKKKYFILHKYLGDIIPRSYFILGEGFSQLWDRGLKGNKYISTKSITIQTKIKGKDASKMSIEEKRNKDFLTQLEKGHKKYVLLKLFLQTVLRELGLNKKSIDLQLDLGSLSNRDTFHYDEIDFIESQLKSPNIMWDGTKVSFIDYGYGKWDDNKEIIFQKMMEDEMLEKWEQLLLIYGVK